MKKNQRAQSEHFQEDICSSMIACNIVRIKIMLRLFQENKSYGVKSISIDPLSTHCCTLQHHVPNNKQHSLVSFLQRFCIITISFSMVDMVLHEVFGRRDRFFKIATIICDALLSV